MSWLEGYTSLRPDELTQNPGLVGRVVEGVPGAGNARKQTQEGGD